MRFWTQYWKQERWNTERDEWLEVLDHTASNAFRKRGVSSGDRIYTISLSAGELPLGGRIVVDRIVDQLEAEKHYKNPDLWIADDHVIGDRNNGTPLKVYRKLHSSVSKRLQFKNNATDTSPLVFLATGQLDNQTARGIRELTADSAAIFDRVLSMTDQSPYEDEPLTVTNKMLAGKTKNATLIQRFTTSTPNVLTYQEGQSFQVTTDRYERSNAARKACIAHHGSNCVICHFDFGLVYGTSMQGFVHVHHVESISRSGKNRDVDPVNDLRPVCPNCHAVLHFNKVALSITAVRKLVRRNRRV